MYKYIQKYFIFFILYSIAGWLYEVFLEVVIYNWGFSNRGVLYGPYCPIYGFGALIFIFCFYKFKSCRKSIWIEAIKIVAIFLGCMLIATSLELLTSYMLEFLIGSWPWQTYSDYKINFQGRIALSPSIRFGLGGILILYVIQPIFEKLFLSLPKSILKIVFVIFVTVFSLDMIIRLIKFFI